MPRKLAFSTATALAVAASLMLAISPNSEQPDLPTGHPSVSMPDTPEGPVEANPEDVQSIDTIIDAYYASVSGPKGQARDWNRFLSLFMPDARFIVAREVDGKTVPLALTPQEFMNSNRAYFERGGYFEQDIHREIDSFGHIAQIFSTYASRRALSDLEPYSRGINSFQLMNTDGRWWITSIMWDNEVKEIKPIPEAYLPENNDDG